MKLSILEYNFNDVVTIDLKLSYSFYQLHNYKADNVEGIVYVLNRASGNLKSFLNECFD